LPAGDKGGGGTTAAVSARRVVVGGREEFRIVPGAAYGKGDAVEGAALGEAWEIKVEKIPACDNIINLSLRTKVFDCTCIC